MSTRGGTEPPKIALSLVIYLLLSAAAFPSSSLCAPLRVIVRSLFKPLDFWLVHWFYMKCSTFKFIGLLRRSRGSVRLYLSLSDFSLKSLSTSHSPLSLRRCRKTTEDQRRFHVTYGVLHHSGIDYQTPIHTEACVRMHSQFSQSFDPKMPLRERTVQPVMFLFLLFPPRTTSFLHCSGRLFSYQVKSQAKHK